MWVISRISALGDCRVRGYDPHSRGGPQAPSSRSDNPIPATESPRYAMSHDELHETTKPNKDDPRNVEAGQRAY
jgi:hypothetical protein